jgi:ATP-binding cassette subfamily B protein
MTEHYEDEDASRGRTLSNGQVLAFIARLWLRRPWLLTGAVGLMLVAVVFDLMLPSAAKALIDAVSSPVKDAGRAWGAWGLFVGVYVAFVVTRNIGFRFWNPLAARNMRELTDEAFRNVQSFSADWHADNFAGATVRKVSRAMWGYDSVSDAVILWLGPALLVLAGLCIQMAVRWPLVGLLAGLVVAGFIWANLWLVKVYVRPTNLKSIALDSRIGGALADAIGSNPTVKTFGAEAREEARFGQLTDSWHRAVQRTWGRFMDVWVVQNILTVMLQAGSTGILVHLWLKGQATAGDLGFAITAFMLMSGYLRNIGENVRMLQKGLDDAEDVAAYARMAPQVADRPDAAEFVPGAGEIVFERATFQYKSAEAPLYDGFSVRIAPGEKVALVGPTGAGKSTFVKLVQRLYDLQGGRILIDGQDVAGVTQGSLRRAIAVVPQDPALFHRTIAENIGYARPGVRGSARRAAARRAQLQRLQARSGERRHAARALRPGEMGPDHRQLAAAAHPVPVQRRGQGAP